MDSKFPLLKDAPIRWIAGAILTVALTIAVWTPNLLRSRIAAEKSAALGHSLRGTAQAAEADHKILETGFMDLLVPNPAETSDKIRRLAAQMGGFTLNANTSQEGENSFASLAIQVPATEFENARAQIRKLGLKVESERLEAKDVTKEYVDESARLRNLNAQELQYLSILKQAKTVKDTLDVSSKLNEVRGQIEQQQAEFNTFSKQVDAVALTISLRSDKEALLGFNWRPQYQLKVAVRDGLEAIGNYAGVMTSILFYLPAVMLWLATTLFAVLAGCRLFVWAKRFISPAVPKAV